MLFMPHQNVVFQNISATDQDWLLSSQDNFDLAAGWEQLATITWNGANYLLQISVTAGKLIAAADLRYTAANGQWTLTSKTPNEWEFDHLNGVVTVKCKLNGAGQEALAAQEPRLILGKKVKSTD